MTNKKTISAVLTGLISASLMSSTALAQKIDFWTLTFSSEKANNALNAIANEFEAKNPGVEIVVTQRGVDAHKTALRVAAGSDSGPDVFFSWAGLGLGGDYVNAGMSLPLDKYYKKYAWHETLLPSVAAFADIYEGGKHGVPYTFKGEVLYYNKDLFAKVGVTDEPDTYEKLLSVAKALKKEGIPAITFGGTVNWHVMRLMDVLLETKCGVDKHDKLIGMELNWSTTPCAIESFAEMKMWADDFFLKPFMGIDHKQAFTLFTSGRAAMMLEGNWLVNRVDKAGIMDSTGIFPFPTGTNRLYGFAEYNYISSTSKNPDTAAAFLDFFNSTEMQQKYLGTISTNSINSKVEYKDLRPMDNEWNDIFANYTQMFVNGDQGFPAKIVPEYFRVINELVSNEMSPQEAGDALQAFIDSNKG